MDLRAWRKEKGLSLKDLVEPLGLSIPQIARIERGQSDPDRDFMRKVYDLTDGAVTPNDFVGVGSTPTTAAA